MTAKNKQRTITEEPGLQKAIKFNLQFLKEVPHEMPFWEIADTRTVCFASADGWGRSAARRVRSLPAHCRVRVRQSPKTWWAALRACSQLAVRGAEEKMEKDQHKRGGRKEQANINVGTLTACFQSKVIEGHYSTHRRLTILSESHEFTTDTHTHPKKC